MWPLNINLSLGTTKGDYPFVLAVGIWTECEKYYYAHKSQRKRSVII